MHGYPVPDNESARLAELQAFDILCDTRDPQLSDIVALASESFDVPIALVTLVGETRQWLKASIGVNVQSTPRELAICNYPISSGRLFVVRDLLSDARFKHNPLVTDGPRVRSYAGVPLTPQPGVHVGTLCIIDTKPRRFSSQQTARLCRMAEIVTRLLRQTRDARALAASTAALARLQKISDRASRLAKIGTWEWSLDTDELTWTDEMYDIHEVPRGSPMTPRQVLDFYPKDVRDEVRRLNAKSDERRHFQIDAPLVTAKGNKRWVRLAGGAERENGVIVRRYGVKQDITEQRAVLDRMRFLAECDALTGLANRTHFQVKLQEVLTRRKARSASVALLVINIDGFKHVNDTLGPTVGDACLRQIAERVQRLCRNKADLAGRVGGDEFALLLASATSTRAVEGQADRVLREMRRTIDCDGHSLQLSASVGVAFSDGTEDRHPDLFAEACLALYAAKQGGRNMARLFTPELKQNAWSRFEVVRNITRALEQRELELFYQPKIRLSDQSLTGFEALLRWRRPDGKVIVAGAFTAALDDPKLSGLIGEFVVEAALCQARDWHRAAITFGHIAINLSSAQFFDLTFAKRLIKTIANYGIRPDMIEIEVTEGVFLNDGSNTAALTIARMRKAGIKVSLDDFGTGYASMSHLKTYPVDTIKIDRSFMTNFLTSRRDQVIVNSIIFMARHLGLNVVAEGIETDLQSQLLQGLGCPCGQGYLYSKALSSADAVQWALTHPVTARPDRPSRPPDDHIDPGRSYLELSFGNR